MAVTVWLGAIALLASAGAAAGRSVPVGGLGQQAQLPPVPGYIPVYIQSGDSPPDVQRLYESHRTLAAHASAPAPVHAPPPAPAPSRRTGGQEAAAPGSDATPAAAAASSGPRPRPQGDAPPLRSRLPVPHREASAPAPVNSRITKKGAAGSAPAVAPTPAVVQQKPQNTKNAVKKRTGTRVQYQQQKAAAQTRKRQQMQRSAKQQQQLQQQQQR